MAANTLDKTLPENCANELRPSAKDGKPQDGPALRMLPKFSGWNTEYTGYQMEACIWRKPAL